MVICLCAALRAGAAGVEDYSTWAHSAKIHINTSPTGANVPRTMLNYSLLVRITDSRIFKQSMGNGSDVRFAGSDGNPFDFQIERWDSAKAKAEVWVRIPQLDSSSDKQYFNVYWGKPDSPWLSNGHNAFSRYSGYSIVYHLGEGGTQTRLNSVGNYNNATPVNYEGDERVEGVIGMADSLDGAAQGGDYLDLGAGFDSLANFTYNAWVKPAKVSSWERLLDVGNGENQDNLVISRAGLSDSLSSQALGTLTYSNVWNGSAYQSVPNVADYGKVVSAPAWEVGKWIFFGVTISGKTCTLYKNGVQIAQGSFNHALNAIKRTKNYIGHSNWSEYDPDFPGVFDEAQIASGAHSPEWMKLSYESQRPGANMLTWEFPPEVKLAIATQPVGATLDEGKPLKLSVVANASGAVSYQWFKDGTALAGATAMDYSIAAVTLADAGTYACRATDGKDTVISKSAPVMVNEDFSTWSHSQKIFFNTTASGANLSAAVSNIPILVRLGKKTLDFSQTGEGGKDLRFAASDGTVLAHAIERWAADTAEVWVRAAKVPANSDKDYITMYWGKSAARQASSPGYVFSLNDNWRFYYSFSDAPSTGGDTHAADATLNGYRGLGSGITGNADGVIGKCFSFAGNATSHVETPPQAIDGLGAFTVLAWVREKAASHGASAVDQPHIFGTRSGAAGQGDFGAYSVDGNAGFWNGMHNGSPPVSYASNIKLNDGNWHLVSMVDFGTGLIDYVDGIPVSSSAADNVPVAANALGIGGNRTAQGTWQGAFTGDIDAVQMTGDAKGADWIKLAYAAQRPGATLLAFGAPAELPPPAPVIDPPGGNYDGPIQIHIATSADGARILYTLDGSAPDTGAGSSTKLFGTSVRLSQSGTIKAISYRNGKASPVATAKYAIASPAAGDTLKPGATRAVDSLRDISYPNQDANTPVLLTLGPAWNPQPAGFDKVGPLFRLAEVDSGAVFPGLALTGDSLSGLSLFRRDPNAVISWMPPKDGQLWIPSAGSYFWARDTLPPRVRLAGVEARGPDTVLARLILEDNVAVVQGKARFRRGGPDSLGWWSTAAGDTLEFPMPVPSDPSAPMEVRFVATDESREVLFPAKGRLTLRRPIPSLAAGLDLKGGFKWKMAGMPMSCDAPVTLRELAQRSGTGPVVAAVWRSHAAPDTGYKILQDEDTLPAGKGFWIATAKDAPSLNFPAASSMASDSDGNFTIALERGWNLVTCPALKPLAWPVSVNDGEAYLRSPLKPLYGFADTGYARPDSLRPWEAYYVYYDKDTVVRVGPSAPRVADKITVPKSAADAGLRLRLSAPGGIRLDLGATPAARAGLGVEDEKQPPALEPRGSAWLAREGRALAVDYVRWDPSQAMAWTVDARSQPAGASLSVSDAALPQGIEAWAVSPSRRLKWRLAPGGNIPVTGDDTLEVYAGTPMALARVPALRQGREAAGAFAVSLRPSAAGLELVLDLPGEARVEAQVLSARGQTLGRLSNRPLSPGRHAFAWSLLSPNNAPLPQGTYWIDLKAKAQDWNRHKVLSIGLVR